MYTNIEVFYNTYKDILLSSTNDKTLRPSKSIVKDVENCFSHFEDYWRAGHHTVTKDIVPKILNKAVDENTRNQNIRVMQEFGFLKSLDGSNVYSFTDSFIERCESKLPWGLVVLDAMYNISGIENLTMYLNYLLCCLREAYTYGEVILFPDSAQKFIDKVPDKATRDEYRQRVYDMYGFIGDTRRAKPHLVTDEYTPNMSYMSRTELENLELLKKVEVKNGLDKLVLTTFGFHLLKTIDNNLSKNSTVKRHLNIVPSSYDKKIEPVIFYGAPGTGKTSYVQKEIYNKYHNDNRYFLTFHQSFSYEEFVEGLKPILDNTSSDVKYHIEKGVFYKACERAAILAGYKSLKDCIENDTPEGRKEKFNTANTEKKTVLLCIDEINRGNVASIFGDLISLIETSKRLGGGEFEMTATLPYSQEEFGVPANLFIVGTMNTADRSIQLLDSALRRRFKFEELQPKYEVIENPSAKDVLESINARVRCLLNKDNQIGHSYLMFANGSCDILSALYNKIIPLLEEYFYNDIEKVRFVLNDRDNSKFYVEDTDAKDAYSLFDGEDAEERHFFKLNPSIADVIKSQNEDECATYLVNLLPKKE